MTSSFLLSRAWRPGPAVSVAAASLTTFLLFLVALLLALLTGVLTLVALLALLAGVLTLVVLLALLAGVLTLVAFLVLALALRVTFLILSHVYSFLLSSIGVELALTMVDTSRSRHKCDYGMHFRPVAAQSVSVALLGIRP